MAEVPTRKNFIDVPLHIKITCSVRYCEGSFLRFYVQFTAIKFFNLGGIKKLVFSVSLISDDCIS